MDTGLNAGDVGEDLWGYEGPSLPLFVRHQPGVPSVLDAPLFHQHKCLEINHEQIYSFFRVEGLHLPYL